MSNDRSSTPFEEDDPFLHDPSAPESLSPDASGQGGLQDAPPSHPGTPVVEAADFLGLDAELSQMAHRRPAPAAPASGQPAGPPPGSASSWLFQENDPQPGAPPAPEEGLRLQSPPPSAVPPAAAARPAPTGHGVPRPGASWLLDPERRNAASAAAHTTGEDRAWLMEQEDFEQPAPSVEGNVELPEGSYYEPEPAGRALGRMALRGVAAGMLVVGAIGAWRAMSVPAPDREVEPAPLVMEPRAGAARGSNTPLEPLEGGERIPPRTARTGVREPGEYRPGQLPAARGGGRELRAPGLLGTMRRDGGPTAGSLAVRRFVFVPEEVAEARGVLANLNALAGGAPPPAPLRIDWAAAREEARSQPALQGPWLAPIWSEELMLAQRALELGAPLPVPGLDPNGEGLALARALPAAEDPAVPAGLPAVPDATPALPGFDPGLLAALSGGRGASLPTAAPTTFDPATVEFPPSAAMAVGRVAAARVEGSRGVPTGPRIAQAGPSTAPLVGVQGPTLVGPPTPFGGDPASVAPLAPPVVTAPGGPAANPSTGPSPLAGLGWPGSRPSLPELSPSTLRRAEPQDLWLRTSIPFDRVQDAERLRTPRVGLVRVVSNRGEVFQGRLYAVGEGQVWLDTSLGRMSLDHDLVQRVERIEGRGKGELNGVPRTAGLERVRVRVAGGYFVGYQLSRQDDRVVLLTDDGNKLTLQSDEVEPDGPRRVTVLRRP